MSDKEVSLYDFLSRADVSVDTIRLAYEDGRTETYKIVKQGPKSD